LSEIRSEGGERLTGELPACFLDGFEGGFVVVSKTDPEGGFGLDALVLVSDLLGWVGGADVHEELWERVGEIRCGGQLGIEEGRRRER